MRYPIFIEAGTKKTAFGVVVPDLPGCFSAGDTLDEALVNAREAVAVWLESQLDNGETIPAAKTIDAHFDDFPGWIPSIVEIDLNEVLGEAERINISLPRRVLRRLDQQAQEANVNRSAYIASLALSQQSRKAVQGEADRPRPLVPKTITRKASSGRLLIVGERMPKAGKSRATTKRSGTAASKARRT